MKRLASSFVCACALLVPLTGRADTANLTLKINGALVAGESSVISLGRANTIECKSLSGIEFASPVDAAGRVLGAAKPTGPIECMKRIDRSSPALFKALLAATPVTGTITLFRTASSQAGEEAFAQLQFSGVITGLSNWSSGTANTPAEERVTFSFSTVTYGYLPTGTSQAW